MTYVGPTYHSDKHDMRHWNDQGANNILSSRMVCRVRRGAHAAYVETPRLPQAAWDQMVSGLFLTRGRTVI